ncbi:nitrogen fixation protein NifX [Paenibacillus anaericanus]|uniref:Nitrogen fixation protein NifX n=1 Tax=Paenibacillus anaericanus TaxID=170367 RepID=A0A433YAY5_9BACL|nr:nitrogen fixation protein NifX [Paenibacillus anaericanus]RUT47024.1 nitrogen fixation protein NifX [Paenibacillus anaericanus]
MKVAFASHDGVTVNAHFGQCIQFAIFEVIKGSSVLLEIRHVSDIQGGDENGRIESRIGAIGDCTLVFIMQIGASAAARVTRRKIMPVKVPMGSSIESQLGRLQELLSGRPPLWLEKILNKENNALEEREDLNDTAR